MIEQELYELLQDSVKQFGLVVSERQWEQFLTYKGLLLDWNTRINLTSITSDKAIMTKHFADSLSIAPCITKYLSLNNTKQASLCDVGTGAGFPGIPLKIMMPELRLILVDSLNKRLVFLEEVVKALALENVEIVHARAEDFGRDPKYRGKIDVSTARAVASTNVLLEYCTPVLKTGGIFIAMKGTKDEGAFEIAAKKLSCALEETSSFTIDVREDDGDKNLAERTLYIFKKTGPTDRLYPRKAGIPAKKPL